VYAIIEDSGKQYRAAQGDILCVDLRPLEDGQSQIEFNRVLFYTDAETVLVGQPLVDGAKVVARIRGKAAGPKLYPTSFRRRKDSSRKIGHRQKYLEVEITEIKKA
jgi:large subunit ribosomal protein L21